MSVAVSCGLVGGLWLLDPQQNSSRIFCCCSESRRSCGYISTGLVPSYAPAIHRWDRCWGGTDVGVGQLKALDLTFCGIWVGYPRDHSHFRQEAEPSLLHPTAYGCQQGAGPALPGSKRSGAWSARPSGINVVLRSSPDYGICMTFGG